MDQLINLRHEIDQVDKSIIELLAERFRITQQIGLLKKAIRLSPVDPQREAHQENQFRKLAIHAGLREEVALKVMRVIIDEVVNDHKRI
jgi:chorismate mutase